MITLPRELTDLDRQWFEWHARLCETKTQREELIGVPVMMDPTVFLTGRVSLAQPAGDLS